nr:reverse transcriptase domain-containing protein [Tanacetum cinerariifolium]
MVRALLLDKKNQYSAPAPSFTPALIKAVKPNCVTCDGTHEYQNYPVTSGNVYQDNIQEYVSQAAAANYGQGNTSFRPRLDNLPRSGTLPGNTITNPKEYLKGITTRSGVSYQGPTIPTPSKVAKQGTESIPYPSRRDNERRRDQANKQNEKFNEIFKDMSFEISFTDALILMPKFSSTLKALIRNKEKLSEMARTPMNEHCSVVILNKLPKKLGDPGKFLIPCEFSGMDECLALADLDRMLSKLIGISKDVSVKVGVFHFLADFVVVDFEPDPRVLLILGRCFLKIGRALIDVHKGELTLRMENEAITYNLDQTSRYSANYDQITANKIDVTDEAYEEYSQEVLGFSDVTASGSPTPSDDPIVSTTFPTLTSFGDSDFLLFEEADLFSEQLKACKAKTIKSSIDEPPEVELKDLHPHLEYVFLEGDNKFPVIIAKELGDEEKSALIKEKTTFTYPYGTFAYRRMPFGYAMHRARFKGDTPFIFSEDYIKAFQTLKKKLTEAPILIAPNWDLLFELMCDASDFAIEMLVVVYAFEKFRSYLIMNKCIVHTDHSALKYLFAKKDAKARLLRWVLLLQEFDFAVIDTKGAENLAADHLSRLENPYENVLDPKEINETFPLETLSMVTFCGDSNASWFADFANYYAGNFIVKVKGKQEKDKIRLKPDKNGKRGKARQCRRPITVKKAKQMKKIQVQGIKYANPTKLYLLKKKARTEFVIISKFKDKGQFCHRVKVVWSDSGGGNTALPTGFKGWGGHVTKLEAMAGKGGVVATVF